MGVSDVHAAVASQLLSCSGVGVSDAHMLRCWARQSQHWIRLNGIRPGLPPHPRPRQLLQLLVAPAASKVLLAASQVACRYRLSTNHIHGVQNGIVSLARVPMLGPQQFQLILQLVPILQEGRLDIAAGKVQRVRSM